jgi:hypothetical protein
MEFIKFTMHRTHELYGRVWESRNHSDDPRWRPRSSGGFNYNFIGNGAWPDHHPEEKEAPTLLVTLHPLNINENGQPAIEQPSRSIYLLLRQRLRPERASVRDTLN